MSEFFAAVILGVFQGISEFLPISSSGHLRILHSFFDVAQNNSVAFDLMLHFATLLAVMLVYRNKYIELIRGCFSAVGKHKLNVVSAYKENNSFKTAAFVVLSSIPTAVIGLLFKDHFVNASLKAVGLSLIITAVILFVPKYVTKEGKEVTDLSWKFALLLGFAQAFAIMPGISRSGTTISVALLLGANRNFAGYYSFLIMVPAVAGATLLELTKISGIEAMPMVVGFFSALIAGYISLKILLKLLSQGRFYYFSPYCLVVGLLVVIFC